MQVDLFEGDVTTLSSAQGVVLQLLVVPGFQVEPVGRHELHEREIVAVVHNHVHFFVHLVNLVNDVKQLPCLLPIEPGLVVPVHPLQHNGYIVVEAHQVQGDDTIDVDDEQILLKVVAAHVQNELFDWEYALHEVDQQVDRLNALLFILGVGDAHFTLFV